jgi:hypothetical protein
METVPSNATAKQLKHPNHSDSGGNTWQNNKFRYTDIYALRHLLTLALAMIQCTFYTSDLSWINV